MNNTEPSAFEIWSQNQGLAASTSGPPTALVQASASVSPLSIENPIILPGGGMSISESAKSLFGRIAPTNTMFCRGGVVVEVTDDHSGGQQLSIVTPSAFRSRIEPHGTILAYRSGPNCEPVLRRTNCSEDMAKALLNTLEARQLPPLSMVTHCPIAVEDGHELKILTHGYHPNLGGIYVAGGDSLPFVGWEEAAWRLKGLLQNFDFVTRSDQSRALASLITPALKMGGLIQGPIPITVAEAEESQTGKGYLLKILAALYGEEPKMIAPRKGGVGSTDESFSQALVNGKPFILLDNFRGKLDSPYIESFLTCEGTFNARVPYRGSIMIDSTRFIVMMSSNGVETTPDLANRSSMVRIRKRHGFDYPKDSNGRDLLQHIKYHQLYYLACILGVVRTWFTCHKLRTSETRHDFREWAQKLDWIVQNIFQSDPLLDGHQGAQQRVSTPAMTFLRNVAIAAGQKDRLNRQLSASDIYALCQESSIPISGLSQGDPDSGKRKIGSLLGPIFKNSNSVEIEGFQVTRTERKEQRAGGGDYLAKFYEFRRVG